MEGDELFGDEDEDEVVFDDDFVVMFVGYLDDDMLDWEFEVDVEEVVK